MATINLREFYPFYTHNYFVEVPDEIAVALEEAERLERNYIRRNFYNKAYYSLDAEDGIETAAITYRDRTPWEVVEMAERFCRLCRALNSLPEIQGRRIEAHYILGKTQRAIARDEGVNERSVRRSIAHGLAAMKTFLEKFN